MPETKRHCCQTLGRFDQPSVPETRAALPASGRMRNPGFREVERTAPLTDTGSVHSVTRIVSRIG